MAVNNLQQFHTAMAALCPIVGVSGDGTIFPDPSATPAQIAAAQSAAATYTDVAPQMIEIQLILDRLVDAEYTALWTFAATHPNVHRALIARRSLDLTQAVVQALIQALVTAGVLTQARATAVFVAPPPIASIAITPPPAPKSTTAA